MRLWLCTAHGTRSFPSTIENEFEQHPVFAAEVLYLHQILRMKHLMHVLAIFLAFQSIGQMDQIATEEGPVNITPIQHSSMMLQWNNLRILTDPHEDMKWYKDLPKADIILITDIHPDHLDLAILEELNTAQSIVIAPSAVTEQLNADAFKRVVTLANGEVTEIRGVEFKAVPMYNLPETPDAFHPKGRGNGYVLTILDRRFYISGDTEDIPEMRALRNIDVAFVSMNLPYTMTIEQAANAVLAFKPRIVYPFHYRGQDGKSDIQQFKKMVNEKNRSIEVRLRDWYAKR